ncbi:OmpA family protein [Rheinheimera sp.]|uniref:MotY family protein n=1 Tax=Rheinheimera sp. TaxID=1869214 RepID=UPI0027BA7F7A|nr:OmpA family protein [Rheinheimera sp.]
MIELLMSLWLTPALSNADQQYVPAVDQSHWQISGDQFLCRMSQPLGLMATLAFAKEPGRHIEMQLQLDATHLELQDVQGQVVTAGWQPEQLAPAVRFSPSFTSTKLARFTEQIPLIMQQLQQGYWLKLSLDLPDQVIDLTVPNLKFEQALQQFQTCIAGLLPLRWEQAREYQLIYPKGERLADADNIAHLRVLASYIQQDKKVRKVLIDGHSDDAATSLANRVLSEERADEVASRLIEFGVNKQKIEIRAHGNRYPQAVGYGGPKHNRRVMIRLIRTPA